MADQKSMLKTLFYSMLANQPKHLFAISYLAITSSMIEVVAYVAKS